MKQSVRVWDLDIDLYYIRIQISIIFGYTCRLKLDFGYDLDYILDAIRARFGRDLDLWVYH